ncbi:MAG: sulfotransferase domain-containing protein [Myxococcota bacterium]
MPRATDVFVATYSKSGTTLLQQIVHGLRTKGDMDFRDISEVVPWIEVAHDLGQDLEAPQKAEPRAFKTHFEAGSCPRGGRVVYVVREPIAALVSFYHFNAGWFMEPGAMDLERFAIDYLLERSGRFSYWQHLASWWPRLEGEDVLPLCYEDVVADLPASVARVARFIGVPDEPDRLEIATRQAHKSFMQRYPRLWEDERLREFCNPAMGLPIEFKGTKVRADDAGAKGDGTALDAVTDRVRETWAEQWDEVVADATGCADYAALRARIASMGPR